jgi:hypothetical protein
LVDSGRKSRIPAEEKLIAAVVFLQKQQKQRGMAIRPAALADRRSTPPLLLPD